MAVPCRRLLWTLLLWAQIGYGVGKISDLRLCGDPACQEQISEGRTLLKYTSNDPQILSFGINVPVKIFSKSAGENPKLWGGEINGRRGYFPWSFIREHRVMKKKLDFFVPTGEVVNAFKPENSFAGAGNAGLSEVQPNAAVQQAETSREGSVMPTRPSILEMEAQEDDHTPLQLSNLEDAISPTSGVSTEAVAPHEGMLPVSGMHQDELNTNSYEGPAVKKLPLENSKHSESMELPVHNTAQSVLHVTLQNMWETVKDSKVLALPWDSIQTVATFGNNFPRSLDQLSDNLLQRIGANADSIQNTDDEIVKKFLPTAEGHYEVAEGTTIWHEPARDNSQISANAEVPLPTKGQSPVSPTKLKAPQQSVSATLEPSMELLSSFTQTPELHKATNAPSLDSIKTQSTVINSAKLGAGASISDNLGQPSMDNQLSVETSSDVQKSVPTQHQQQTLDPTQNMMTAAVTEAAISERAYLGEHGNQLDVSEGEDKVYQPSVQIVPSRSSVEEMQWSSSSADKLGEKIQPSATNGQTEEVAEEQGGWFSPLTRALLGTEEQGQEEPSAAAEDYTREGVRSWMGKEGSQGLPRADSGYVEEPSASQTIDEVDDDTLVGIDDDDDDDEDDDYEESDATLDDLSEDTASVSPSKEEAEATSVKDKNNLDLGNIEHTGDVDSAKNIKFAEKSSELNESATALPVDLTRSSMDTRAQEESKEFVKTNNEPSFTSVTPVEVNGVEPLQEKSNSETTAVGSEPVSIQQNVEKRETDEEFSGRKARVEVDPLNRGSPDIKQGIKADESISEPSAERVSPAENTYRPDFNEETKADLLSVIKVPNAQPTETVQLPSSTSPEVDNKGSLLKGDMPDHNIDASSILAKKSSVSGSTLNVVDDQASSSVTGDPLPPKHVETVTGDSEMNEVSKEIEKSEAEIKMGSNVEETLESATKIDNVAVPNETDERVTFNENLSSDAMPNVDTTEAEEGLFDPSTAYPRKTEKDRDSATETIPQDADQPGDQTVMESTYGFFAFFEELDLMATGKGYVAWLRPYVQLLIDLLPEPIHASLMDFEDQGLSPRVLVFTVISGGFLALIIIAYYVVKRGSHENVLKLKLCQVDKKLFEAAAERDIVKEELDISKQQIVDLQTNLSEAQEAIELLDTELLSTKTECGKLQAAVASLEEQLETATEAGLELNNMLSDFLTSQNEGHKLQESVALLQEQLDLQKNSVNDMQSNAKNKSQQYSALKEEHEDALLKIEDLERENKKLRLEVDESESKYDTTKLQVDLLEKQAVQLQENNKQLLREAEIWNQRIHELQDQVESYSANNKELKDSLSTKMGEIEVLKDIIQQLKVMQDDDTGAVGDSEKLQKLMDASRITAELNAVSQEKSCIVEHLSAEIEKRKSLEDALSKTVTEVEQLRESHAALSQQRDEAYTKLQVLSGYFKEKEIELQRELGVQEAMRQQSQESVLSVGQRAALYEQEVSMYKSQIDDLKKEIESQGRSYKNQIAQHESKAHDSWLAARAAERKAEEARQEAALLRNKLTLIEQEKESLQGQGDGVMVKPMPKRFTGSNGEVPSPPRLDSEPSDLPVSGPPSLLRESLDSPRRMPFLPLDRPMPPPALGFPPPFLRDRFPPPPLYDLHGPPFDLHGPPPPPYLPHHRPFDHRMSPPQGRRSPPLRRMSPPFDPHSPLPPRDYRSPPPIDRRGPPDRLQSPDPFDRRPPSGRHTSPPHLSRERNYPGPYERDFRERSPPRFHERGPPAGILASGMRPGPPPLRRDPFPDNRIGALTNPRTSSPLVDLPADPQQAHPTTQV